MHYHIVDSVILSHCEYQKKHTSRLAYKFTVHCDSIFRALRRLRWIQYASRSEPYENQEASFLASLDPFQMRMSGRNHFLAHFSEGKSNSFFWRSADGILVLKTITQDELKFISEHCGMFYFHFLSNPASLLTRILGCYSIQVGNMVPSHFLVMENVMHSTLTIQTRFDLKGSSVGRSQTPMAMGDCTQWGGTLGKDRDMSFKLSISEPKRRLLMRQVELDAAFLQSVGSIDYSFLVGIHRCKDHEGPCVMSVHRTHSHNVSTSFVKPVASSDSLYSTSVGSTPRPSSPVNSDADSGLTERIDERSSILSQQGLRRRSLSCPPNDEHEIHEPRPRQGSNPSHETVSSARVPFYRSCHGGMLGDSAFCHGEEEVYFVRIIDYLETYSLRKRLERVFKSLFLRRSAVQISAQEPRIYAQRFYHAMTGIFSSQ